MDDDIVAQFSGITGASTEQAIQYITISEGNIEQAVQLFFETEGADLGGQTTDSTQPAAPPAQPHTQHTTHTGGYEDASDVVYEDLEGGILDDNHPQTMGYSPHPPSRPQNPGQSIPTPASATPPTGANAPSVDDDEAMARRLQEEMYAGTESFGNPDPNSVRAPIARTTETLVGPGSQQVYDEEDMEAAVAQARARRFQGRTGRPGIFNQRDAPSSIWTNDELTQGSGRREQLARSTGGASETSSKNNKLAEMFRPPFEIMSRVDFEEGRQKGRDQEKWLLVNIQDPSVFGCQVLNRDLWKDTRIQETIRTHFIFMQYNKDDTRGTQYVQYYFPAHDNQDAYPHIAIVDPRTGEQVKVWSGSPAPQPTDFLMQLHDFLDRYSLKHDARNPVAKRKAEMRKDKRLDMMSDEEMLEMALQNSLATQSPNRQEDPDDLTRSIGDVGKGKKRVINLDDEDDDDEDEEMQDVHATANGHTSSSVPPTSPFTSIASDRPHIEPAPDSSTTTRIQFRHSGGRVIRRFALADPVRRIYEWLKASPLEGKEGVGFELIFMTRNLIDALEDTVEEAGLKNGTVMIEFED